MRGEVVAGGDLGGGFRAEQLGAGAGGDAGGVEGVVEVGVGDEHGSELGDAGSVQRGADAAGVGSYRPGEGRDDVGPAEEAVGERSGVAVVEQDGRHAAEHRTQPARWDGAVVAEEMAPRLQGRGTELGEQEARAAQLAGHAAEPAAIARPAWRPEKMHPPRKVPSRER